MNTETTSRSHPRRKCIRLRGYDYAQPGAYFVTHCTQDRACLFGDVSNGEMRLNAIGKIVAEEWAKTAEIRDEVDLDEWVVMSDHFHGILVIIDSRSRGGRQVAPTKSAPRGIRLRLRNRRSRGVCDLHPLARRSPDSNPATKRINMLRETPGMLVWQRNFHEHIIRDNESLNNIREYILANPSRWATDRDNPFRTRPSPSVRQARHAVPDASMS